MQSKFISKPTSLLLQQLNLIVKNNINVDNYRSVKTQIIYNSKKQPDHLLLYLFSKKYHRVDMARINISPEFKTHSVISHYSLTAEDFSQQNTITKVECPDQSVQFIVFAPNNDKDEQAAAKKVGDSAESHHLKTIRLLHLAATRRNYLNYMSCPHLLGNFYDGEGYHNVINPDEDFITTIDGFIKATEIGSLLQNAFRFKVVNLWLACSIYNDPFERTMQLTAQSQKFGAGQNDLLVGPSDDTAVCAMRAAFDGKPMESSFEECYKKFDKAEDHWGFAGYGFDYFGN
jgi:hypothetical protein